MRGAGLAPDFVLEDVREFSEWNKRGPSTAPERCRAALDLIVMQLPGFAQDDGFFKGNEGVSRGYKDLKRRTGLIRNGI